MSKHILIVDDSESILELVGSTLESDGYQITKGSDGTQALSILDGRNFNLVITDLNMPHMDGIELIRAIRKNESYYGLPILVLTTESQVSKKEDARVAGATGWIIKPFNQQRLLEVVKKVIR